MNKFIRFGMVGSIGFLVDAGVLIFLVEYLNQNVYISRIFSFLIAVFVTWILNRNFTFEKKKDKKKKEYFYYLIIQTFGAGINYAIFIYLVKFNDINILISLGLASSIAMFFNFYMLKKIVYNNYIDIK